MKTCHAPCCSAQSAIVAANAAFVNAFLAHSATDIARHYRPQGRLLLSHVELITGQFAIRAFWQGVLDMGLSCTERTTMEWQSTATLANEIGTYVLRYCDGTLADRGTYVALWQWGEDRWQIRYEVWRSSLLAPLGEPRLRQADDQ